MSRRAIDRQKANGPRPEEALSFFRYATAAEREAGAMPLVFWSVDPAADYMADVERGKAIASELLAYVAASPTNGNMTLLSSVLLDMQRFGSTTPKGVLVGFGRVMMNSALIGAVVAGVHGFSEIRSPYTKPPADPCLAFINAWEAASERCAQAPDDASVDVWKAECEPFDRAAFAGEIPIATTAAGAAAAIRKAINFGDMQQQDKSLLAAALAYLEGAAPCTAATS